MLILGKLFSPAGEILGVGWEEERWVGKGKAEIGRQEGAGSVGE
jgi:hypothetical protein